MGLNASEFRLVGHVESREENECLGGVLISCERGNDSETVGYGGRGKLWGRSTTVP